MKTAEFLYDSFILRVSYDHLEAEHETGTSEHVEVQMFEYIAEIELKDRTISTMQNLTPFISEFCDHLFEDFGDRIQNDSKRDFRSKSKDRNSNP